jgi:hypothetical protein
MEKSRPVAVVLRPGKTPSGVEVRGHLRRLTRHIRKSWPETRLLFRGDGHYARPEAMAWCEDHGVDYIFGLPGTKPLSKKVDETADAVRVERALDDKDVVRGYAETRHRAKSWDRERRAIARIEGRGLASTSALPSPISRMAPRNGSTTASIARADRRRTSSSCTRRSFAPIEPHAARRSPIRFASSCTPPPIG